MNKYNAIIVIKPDMKKSKIEGTENKILNLFEQKTNIKKVWYQGKKRLDFKNNKYTEGIHLKLEILAKANQIEDIKSILTQMKEVLCSMIFVVETEKTKLSLLEKCKRPFNRNNEIPRLTANTTNKTNKNVYLLISKNLKLPFSQTDIIAISDNIEKIIETGCQKIKEYLYIKGYTPMENYSSIKDIEKCFRNSQNMKFLLNNNVNVGQELVIQEKTLI